MDPVLGRRPGRAPFLAVAFLGSFLLFTIELIAGKLLVPRFGAAAQVWTVCMMFYQGLLLAGYLHCRGLPARLGAARYARFHLLLLAAPLALFPLGLRAPAAGGAPIPALLAALAASIGAPFFVLATTSPVVQGWLALSRPEDAEASYSVYAASNAGALAALLGYPLLIEPLLTVGLQLKVWQGLYALYAAAHLACLPGVPNTPSSPGTAGLRPPVPPPESREAPGSRLSWFLLALGPSASLLAATNLLLMDFAAVPLLWTAPLAVYLATFILCFKRRPWYPQRLSMAAVVGLAAWTALVLLTVHFTPGVEGFLLLRRLWSVNKLFFILVSLFVLCLISHRALARAKPPAEGSAAYYSWLAAGGWGGSLLVGVLLPAAARHLARPELDWGLAGLLCIGALLLRDREAGRLQAPPRWAAAAGAVLLFGTALLYAVTSRAFAPGAVFALRNFYGFYSVEDRGPVRVFSHGRTIHGTQYLDPARQDEPLLYYYPASPIGELFDRVGSSLRAVGVVGLGSGALAAYGRPGQTFDFYELDPDVASIARRLFTYLDRSRAAVTVTTGDGRLALAAAEGKRYDLLVLDAFSGGAVPVHLLTREACAVYQRRLAPRGLLVFHITSRFLDLRPVVAALARDRGLSAVWKVDANKHLWSEQRFYSSWAALSPDPARLAPLLSSGWKDLSESRPARVWTDDYANLWAALGG